MLRKIITYFLILAVVLPILAGAIPLPIGGGVNVAQAADATKFTSSKGTVYDPCAFTDIVFGSATVAECTSYKIVNFLYDWVLSTTIWIAGLAGNLFNASIQFSLTGKVFDADENTMIKDGWTLVRDLLNLVFIFILLFASISTILQYGGFEIKKVLPSLIVVALLVNFSMMIAKMVIDASHIFAWEFYNQIDVKNEEGLGEGELFANIKNDINVYGEFEKKNLANVFIAGFNPQELLTGKEAKEGEEDSSANKSLWKQAVEKKIDEGKSISDVWWQMGLIVLLESALALFAGFILLAGAIMFVVRVVVLWLVMIFSPIAFLGMILPSMKQYSSMWWKYLIGQSFFAPAFLFMFMLVTKFINSDFVDSIFKASASGTSDSMIVLGINGGTIALTFFHFFVVGGLMMACLIVAKQLGGKTAEFGISWAHKGKEMALGGANKMLWKPASYYGKRGLGYGGQRFLQGQVQRDEKGNIIRDENGNPLLTKFGKSMSWIPGLNRGIAKVSAIREKQMKDEQKKVAKELSGYSDEAFAVVRAGGKLNIPTTIGQKAVTEVQKKKLAEEEKNRRIKEETKELEALKYVESKELIFKDKFKKEIEKLEESIEGFETDLVAQNYKLAKAIEEGKTTEEGLALSAIDAIKQAKLKKNAEKKIKEEKIKKIEKQETRRKELEEKMERRKETEGLQETIKTSGSGGGGASKGGGGKTTP